MSLKNDIEDIKKMNSWEWFAWSIIGFFMAWYMSAGFPIVALCCGLFGIVGAIMTIGKLGN